MAYRRRYRYRGRFNRFSFRRRFSRFRRRGFRPRRRRYIVAGQRY